MSFPALERWRALPRDSDRDEYFRILREAVAEFYLADPSNPYQQSGRSSGAERWKETRRCLVRAIHRDGDFLDVGCANGLLLETLIVWAEEEGFSIRAHGIDVVPELIELARQRFPQNVTASRLPTRSTGCPSGDTISFARTLSMFPSRIGPCSFSVSTKLFRRAAGLSSATTGTRRNRTSTWQAWPSGRAIR
jgi:SAM-dependent methyltransferase